MKGGQADAVANQNIVSGWDKILHQPQENLAEGKIGHLNTSHVGNEAAKKKKESRDRAEEWIGKDWAGKKQSGRLAHRDQPGEGWAGKGWAEERGSSASSDVCMVPHCIYQTIQQTKDKIFHIPIAD